MSLTRIPRGLKLHDLRGLEIVAGRYRHHSLPRHVHDGLMLSLLSDGVQVLNNRGVNYTAGAGAMLAIPPNEVHAAEPGVDEGWYYHTVTIPSEVLVDHHPEGAGFSCDTLVTDDRIFSALRNLLRSLSHTSALKREEALYALLDSFLIRHTRLLQKNQHKPTEARAVRISKEYLAAHVEKNVTLGELAKIARIDRFLLVRCFTSIVGMPPHAWHMQRRLQRSIELLSKGDPVADVALATGFSDQAHLTRSFKRVTGITPGLFRKDHLILQAHRATALANFAIPLPSI